MLLHTVLIFINRLKNQEYKHRQCDTCGNLAMDLNFYKNKQKCNQLRGVTLYNEVLWQLCKGTKYNKNKLVNRTGW